MAGGRPTIYSEELAVRICELVATSSLGLIKLCAKYDELPVKDTINQWRYRYPGFSALYAKAKLIQADRLAEDILDIADEARGDIKLDDDGNEVLNSEFVARSRLKIDTRKWLAAKLLPRQYGNHTEENKNASDSLVEKLIDKLK